MPDDFIQQMRESLQKQRTFQPLPKAVSLNYSTLRMEIPLSAVTESQAGLRRVQRGHHLGYRAVQETGDCRGLARFKKHFASIGIFCLTAKGPLF